MDKTTTLMFRAACAVVIGWGVVNTINFTRSALADRQAAPEAEEERRVVERWAEQQRQAAVERLNSNEKGITSLNYGAATACISVSPTAPSN